MAVNKKKSNAVLAITLALLAVALFVATFFLKGFA